MEDIKDHIPHTDKVDVSKSAWKNLLLGGLCGVISGKIFSKGFKIAAIATAGGLLLIHTMNRQGIITIDKDKMTEAAKNAKSEVQRKIQDHIDFEDGTLPRINNIYEYIGGDSKYIVIGFAGGFVLGLL
ncbi:hypothetical protein JTE90_019097 [Oedothorax gibbosus]|uniref:FUN14 domain-containing protein 1 n=1 Tax=Oedothorax gibbosus TaxID=931172 RepID=A0AAV6VA96_9ARAC|nr:hypothetical protein JTE90_019097 [Oedothorax gibbosus]